MGVAVGAASDGGAAGCAGVVVVGVVVLQAVVAGGGGVCGAEVALGIHAGDLRASGPGSVGLIAEVTIEAGGGVVAEVAPAHP